MSPAPVQRGEYEYRGPKKDGISLCGLKISTEFTQLLAKSFKFQCRLHHQFTMDIGICETVI